MLRAQVAEFIKSRPMPTGGKMDALPIQAYRAAFDLAISEGNALSIEPDDVVFEEMPSPIPVLGAADLVLRVYQTRDSASDTALVLCAGTGFVHNNPGWNDQLHRALASKTGYKIFVVAGRVAPEFKFPTGLEDSYATFKWILANAETFGVDPSKIGLGGFSSGGNFAALTTIRAVREGIPIAFQVLMSPFLDLSSGSSLYRDLASEEFRDYLFGETIAKWLVSKYLPEGIDPKDPRVSPIWDDISGLRLPPTFIMATEFEPLHEECRLYAEKLSAAGIRAVFHLVPGQIHEYLGCNRGRLVSRDEDPVSEIVPFLRAVLAPAPVPVLVDDAAVVSDDEEEDASLAVGAMSFGAK